MRCAIAIAALVRLDTSLIAFLSIFIPILAQTGNLENSTGKAIPILFISICTFIANDLDDLESDRVNHPERPLPAESITGQLAALLYFASLACALFTIKKYTISSTSFLYYLLLILAISYTYITENIPELKALYVASASSIPIVIIARILEMPDLYLLALSLSLFILGRELCMDLLDRLGDTESLLHRASSHQILVVAFGSQSVGLVLLIALIDSTIDLIMFSVIALLLLICAKRWNQRPRLSLHLMKLQLLAGLVFTI